MIQVILPALDEAQAIPGVLAAFPAGYEPLVVDNGSHDETAAVAVACGATVIREPQPRVRGRLLCRPAGGGSEIVCFMDCDGSLDPAQLPRVTGPVAQGSVDLSLGARRPQPGAWPWHARLANRALAFELRRRTALRLTISAPCARRGARPCSVCD